jgi:hypothetical protein
MNLLAHGSTRRIGECVLRHTRTGERCRAWQVARSLLAYAVLDLTDLEFTVADL